MPDRIYRHRVTPVQLQHAAKERQSFAWPFVDADGKTAAMMIEVVADDLDKPAAEPEKEEG